MHLLTNVSLKNRAFTALWCVAVAVLGILSMLTMRQELIPSVQLPQVMVIATQPGASSEQMHDNAAQPIEQAVRGMENVSSTSSTSNSSFAQVTVELDYGTDVARSSNQIEAELNRLDEQLPDELETQLISGGTGDIPAAVLSVSSELDTSELLERLEAQLVPELERVDGIANVMVTGGATGIVRITPDQAALADAGLTPQDITTAIEDSGLSVPGGTVVDEDRVLDVTVGTEVSSLEDLESLPVLPAEPPEDATQLSAVVTLGEVSTVEETVEEQESISRTNGRDSLTVMVTPTADGNLVDVSEGIHDVLDEQVPQLGGDANAEVVFDQAPFIEESITALAEEGLLGLVFAIGVILVFLLAVRPTIVTAVSIPLSLLMTFIGMLIFGYSVNMLTIAAVTISIGRVVDDSIVVIENITRHLSYGTPRRRAITTAVREVGGAITASTFATVIVFLPIALVGDMAGELFRPFSLTVAIAMLSSLFVALTIVPVLAYWFLRAPKALRTGQATADEIRERAEEKERRNWLNRAYRGTLNWTQKHAWVTVAIALAVVVGTAALWPLLKINLLGDAGQNFAAYTQTLQAGTSLEESSEKATEAEEAMLEIDGVQTVQTTIGGGSFGFGGGAANAISYSLTTDPDADQEAVKAEIESTLESLPDSGEIEDAMGAGMLGSSDVTLEIAGATSAERQEASDLLVAEFDPLPEGVAEVHSDLEADQPTVVISVDREAAAQVGLSENAVVGIVAGQLYEQPIGAVTIDDTDLDIYLEQGEAIDTLDQLDGLQVMGMPITDLATLEETLLPPTVTSQNNRETVTVAVTPATDDVQATTDAASDVLERVDGELPDSVEVSLGGAAMDIEQSFADLGLAISAAIMLTYVLLVWIFKSLVQPLVLLVSIPFAATGSLGLLVLTQVPLGLPSLIGLLMLVGIVVTNAIVLIDLINQRRRDGWALHDAIMDGAQKRLRPILMTSAATIFALIPMGLGFTGQGGFISQPLAIVVIGGLITSTLLTLVLVPVLYRLTESPGEKRRLKKAAAGELDDDEPVPAPSGGDAAARDEESAGDDEEEDGGEARAATSAEAGSESRPRRLNPSDDPSPIVE